MSSLKGPCDGVSVRIKVQSRTEVQETGRYLPLVSGWGFWIQHISTYKVVFSSNNSFCKTSGTLKLTKQSEWIYGLTQVKCLAYTNSKGKKKQKKNSHIFYVSACAGSKNSII